MKDIKEKYEIIETPCFPNKWKVVRCLGKLNNVTYLFHKELKDAIYQVEEIFKGEVVDTKYLIESE